MEEVLDVNCVNNGPTLPREAPAIIMTNEEYYDTLPKGEKPTPTAIPTVKTRNWQKINKIQECQLNLRHPR
jgi:hypothetical protein